jgi:hypothetical protein
MRKMNRPAEARNTAIPVVNTAVMWLEMQSRGFWLTSADVFLVEIAATLMARYRFDQIKSGDVSLLIGLLGKIGFPPKDRSALNLPAT